MIASVPSLQTLKDIYNQSLGSCNLNYNYIMLLDIITIKFYFIATSTDNS